MKIGQERIWSLAYADDMVLLAEGRETLLDMMDSMKRFFRKRELILSTEKTKVLVFGRNGNEKKQEWTWEGKRVKEFKYLGFTFERNGRYCRHLKDLRKKRIFASKKVWKLC